MEYYITKEQFETLKTKWKEIEHPTAADHIIYNVLRSKPIDTGFCPKIKKQPHELAWQSFYDAKNNAAKACSPRQEYKQIETGVLIKKKQWQMVEINDHLEKFKEKFGFDMPEDLADQINTGAHHE